MASPLLFLVFFTVTLVDCAPKTIFVARGYAESCTEGLMKIRTAFNAGNIQWDQNLANGAEEWAKKLAISNYMRSSSTNLGENVYYTGYINNHDDFKKRMSCSHALWSWYNVIRPSKHKGTLVQLVGERVKRFGIGVAINPYSKRIFVVGRFDANIPWDTWWYHQKKESWAIPSRERLISTKGTVTFKCLDRSDNYSKERSC